MGDIKPGTICLVVFTAPRASKYLGRTCEYIGILHPPRPTRLGVQDMLFRFDGNEVVPGARKCVIPLTPPSMNSRTKKRQELNQPTEVM